MEVREQIGLKMAYEVKSGVACLCKSIKKNQ